MSDRPYNGYTPAERAAKGRELQRLRREGLAPSYSGPCMICGDPDTPVEPHSEDYARPYRWEPPAMYWLCRHCHRNKLHKRFADEHAWQAYKAHVLRGGYASDLKTSRVRREVERHREALASGAHFELRALRPRVPSPADEWWLALSTEAASLTNRAARPRADAGEQAQA